MIRKKFINHEKIFLLTYSVSEHQLPMQSFPLCCMTLLLNCSDHFHGESHHTPWGKHSGNCTFESFHFIDEIAHVSGFSQRRSKPTLMNLMKQQILLLWNTKEAYNIIHYWKHLHTWNKCLVCPLFVQINKVECEWVNKSLLKQMEFVWASETLG